MLWIITRGCLASLHCREIDMPGFIEFRQNAMKLTERLSGKEKSQQVVSCTTFFQPTVLDKKILEEACTISAVATCLDKAYDRDLIHYLQDQRPHSLLTQKEFLEFKTKVLVGCYLFKWRQYSSFVSKLFYGSLIILFQEDLNINDLSELSNEEIDSYFATLVQFCSFLHANQSSAVYKHAYAQLGSSIQLDIHNARYPKSSTAIISEVVETGMQSIGFK